MCQQCEEKDATIETLRAALVKMSYELSGATSKLKAITEAIERQEVA